MAKRLKFLRRRIWIPIVVVILLVLGVQGWRMRHSQVPDLEPSLPIDPPKTISVKSAPYIWWEAEKPSQTNFPKANPFAPNPAEIEVLSGGDWIGVATKRSQPLFLEYSVAVKEAGTYEFAVRKFWQHGPFRWRWDQQEWAAIGKTHPLLDGTGLRPMVGVNWVSLGAVQLSAGSHTLRVELTENEGAAAFDCFVLTKTPFKARGKLKPDQRFDVSVPGWFAVDPEPDNFQPSLVDLRSLNERVAGDGGWIQAKGEELIHEKTGKPERFWAVNISMEAALGMPPSHRQHLARSLSKQGVNLVRLHGRMWPESDPTLTIPQAHLDQLVGLVNDFKQQGIYTGLSIYFPMWTKLSAVNGVAGYNNQTPVSSLFFSPAFQKLYFEWWKTIFSTVNPATGQPLGTDPAIALVELVNEDSLLFWTFNHKAIPPAQIDILETQFGQWVARKHGSVAQAIATWEQNSPKPPLEVPDRPEKERVSILPLANLLQLKTTLRAQDTAAFLTDVQQQFFQQSIQTIRKDFQYNGLIVCSNWITADPALLGPLDKFSNTVGDIMDRHGYFDGGLQGDTASFMLAPGQTYNNRSALFLNDPKANAWDFGLPIMDLRYNNKPSMISELGWTLPNRYRAELPWLMAAYGSLQGTDGFVPFWLDKPWDAKLDKFSIATPATLGQFPAAALMYRKGWLKPGESVVDANLNVNDLKQLKGSPVLPPQNLDQFRAKEVQQSLSQRFSQTADPFAYLVGKVNVQFSDRPTSFQPADLSAWIDRRQKQVRSTTGELQWNYSQGLLTINAPKVQVATGFLKSAGTIQLGDITLRSDMEYGAIALVPLDDQPLATSRRMLLQVMSEEQNYGWQSSRVDKGRRQIDRTGTAPILVRNLSGEVTFSGNSSLKLTPLDANGRAIVPAQTVSRIQLAPNILSYWIERG